MTKVHTFKLEDIGFTRSICPRQMNTTLAFNKDMWKDIITRPGHESDDEVEHEYNFLKAY